MVAKFSLKSLAFGALLAAAGSALAGPIQPGDVLQIGNVQGNAFTPSPIFSDANGLYTNVTFRLDNHRNVNASAGLFVLDQRPAAGGDWETFYSFCLQPEVFLMPFSNPYTAFDLSGSGYSSALAELWGRHRGSVVDDISAAAFQVSIWELAYDGDGSLASGAFQLVSQGAVSTLASNWLASIDGNGPLANNLRVLRNNPNLQDRQDLITDVPAPASLGLLLASLATLRLRRRS